MWLSSRCGLNDNQQRVTSLKSVRQALIFVPMLSLSLGIEPETSHPSAATMEHHSKHQASIINGQIPNKDVSVIAFGGGIC
jgi:hypothetical protein